MVTVSGDAAATIVIEQLCVAEPEALSATLSVNVEGPALVGIPETCPLAPSSATPAGNCPVTIDHVYGGAPPAAASDELYACPTVPEVAGQPLIDTPAPIIIAS